MNAYRKAVRLQAAIMFVDIVGYTTLMQRDEERAIAIRNRKRQLLKILAAKHKGEIIQYYGDGALNMFRGANEAAGCAFELQKQMLAENIPVRIGIHMGVIVRDREGIYGDAVNVAARIESLSAPGCVLLSEQVAEKLREAGSIRLIPVGVFTLRNVALPLRLFAIRGQGLKISSRGIRQRWEKQTCGQTASRLAQHYLSDLKSGVLN